MHLSKLRLGVVGVACAMVVGMPSVAIGSDPDDIELETGPDEDTDGFLSIVPDAYGAWSSTTFGGGGDLFKPTGKPLQEAAFTSGFFIFVLDSGRQPTGQRELLTANNTWQNVVVDDNSLSRAVTSPLVFSDTTGDGEEDTANSSFAVTGTNTDLTFVLVQQVRVFGPGVSYLEQDYSITNNSNVAINFAMVRAFDGHLVWNAGFENDEVGTTMHGAGLGPYVFEQEASDPDTAITLSSRMGGDYYGGKRGVIPGQGPPSYGFGTDVQVWNAFGVPPSWRSHIAGVDYFMNGVSGVAPPGSIAPEDGFIGMDFQLSLAGLASTSFTVFHTYGQNTPGGPGSIANFEDPQEFPAAGEPNIAAVSDLDGDGTDDVVTAIPDQDPLVNGVVQIFLNQGTIMGEWQGLVPNMPVTVGREPTGVAVGLFNTDLFVDVAVTNAGDNTVSILLNQGTGDGSLSPPVDIIVGNRPSAIVAADFNLDTFVDLAVTNQLDGNVMLLLNDGMGNFPPPPPPGGGGGAGGGFPTFPTGGDAFSLVTDDFDGNKRPDMAGTARTSGFAGPTGLVFVLLGLGDGTFEPVAVHNIGLDPLDLATADLQQDGAVDIVAVNSGDATVSILLNQLDGTFGPASTLPVGLNPRSIDAVDLNGDGDSDLAVVADDSLIGPSVQVLANRIDLGGGLVFEDPVAFGVDADPNFIVSADLNNDGIFDLVTVNADDGATPGSVTALLADPIFPLASCPWDCQAVPTGAVDVPDLLALLGAWGGPQTPGTRCDFDGSGVIVMPDLLQLLANFGPCP